MGPHADLSRSRPLAISLVACAGLAAFLGGCGLDTYFDPSKPIRAEVTPTTVPILDRIAAIEGPQDQYVEFDEIRPEDLQPEASEYRIGPGDQVEIRVWDILVPGQVEIYPMLVDQRGIVTIPQLGEIELNGLTAEQTRDRVAEAASVLINEPLVQVTVGNSRSQTFTIFGAVAAAGSYYVPTADYRLLDAITGAGGIAETVPELYVIRQIPLEQETMGGSAPSDMGGNGASGEGFIDILDSLTGEGGSPGVLASSQDGSGQSEPAIDLIEGDVQPDPTMPETDSAWIFVNGEWVRTMRATAGTAEVDPGSLVTQRVIRVDTAPLLAGDARYNVVIRAGDIIRVPPADQGFIYLEGEIVRGGSYNLPAIGPYTLRRAIASAGGLTPTGIPERCDLTRMVGNNRQATIMLNYRAIVEGTQPDVVLKPNDIITMGTTFWAYPLAVVRNGFRATYGFGFLLDRNFGNDVFGAPPTNRVN